jgi:hypothetical protein
MRDIKWLAGLCLIPLLTACFSFSRPEPPVETTVTLQAQAATLACQDGTAPPCG